MTQSSASVLSHFASSETGAVTVDWVVLTAGLVGLGLAVSTVVSSGVEDLSNDTNAAMTDSVVFTTFAQRTYSDYYLALLAHEGAGFTGYADAGTTPAAYFESHVSAYQSQSDEDLAAFARNWVDSAIPEFESRIAQLDTLDPETVTAADFLTIEPYASDGSTEATIQAAIDEFGGDASAYYVERRANRVRKLERFKMGVQMADERGLTY